MAELNITDAPPDEVRKDLDQLKLALDGAIPSKKLDRNLLISTWNIRAFGRITKKWESGSSDTPKRDFHAVRCIAEILSRFDVVAVQEVRENIQGLRYVMKLLGPSWSFVLTDVTKGDSGNGERMAYLFDTRKVQLSGLACELVVPEEQLKNNIEPDALERQFARTPYAVSFQSGGKTFILTTMHLLYGDSVNDRLPELRGIAQWMKDWATDVNAFDHNLILLGDFNIDNKGDARYEAFTSTGLSVPVELDPYNRSIFNTKKYYDQIAWFRGDDNGSLLSLEFLRGGIFDFTTTCLQNRSLTRQRLSYLISDHYPLWTEFSVQT